jgi:hypothetical protein
LFENFDVPATDPARFRVEVLFSPGAFARFILVCAALSLADVTRTLADATLRVASVLRSVGASAGAAASPFTGESNVASLSTLATAYDPDNHTLPVLQCVPISEPGLTLASMQALLRTAIDSEGREDDVAPSSPSHRA